MKKTDPVFQYTKLIKYTKYDYCCAEIVDNRSFGRFNWSKKGITVMVVVLVLVVRR